jgi:hypothetical protein
MNEINKFADDNNLIIGLTPEQISNTSKSNLLNFYKKLGFVPNKGKNKDWNFREALIRYPKNNEIMENKLKGGKSDGKTPEDIAKSHGVSLDSIKNEIKIGHTIEIEHTTDKSTQLEIILDHLMEFPDYYSNKRYGLIKMEKNLEKVSESSYNLIKNLLREGLNGEKPIKTINFIIKDKGRAIGNAIIDPNKPNINKETIQLMNITLFEEYDDLPTAKKVITSLWRAFPDVYTILIAPIDGTEPFWSKLGANRLNNDFLMFQRGH